MANVHEVTRSRNCDHVPSTGGKSNHRSKMAAEMAENDEQENKNNESRYNTISQQFSHRSGKSEMPGTYQRHHQHPKQRFQALKAKV